MPNQTHLSQTAYTAVTTALDGLAAAQQTVAVSTVENLVATGWTDWWVTDAEATQAFNTIAGLGFSQRGPAITALADKWTTVIENLPEERYTSLEWAKIRSAVAHDVTYGPALDEAGMKTMFDMLPDSDIQPLIVLIGWRFQTSFEGMDGAQWTSDALRRAWEILEQLPPGHVQGNDLLEIILRDQAGAGSGYYSEGGGANGEDLGVMGYNAADLGQTGS